MSSADVSLYTGGHDDDDEGDDYDDDDDDETAHSHHQAFPYIQVIITSSVSFIFCNHHDQMLRKHCHHHHDHFLSSDPNHHLDN